MLWILQFAVPSWREEISVAYAVWLVAEIGSVAWRPGRLKAFVIFPRLWTRA